MLQGLVFLEYRPTERTVVYLQNKAKVERNPPMVEAMGEGILKILATETKKVGLKVPSPEPDSDKKENEEDVE